MSGAVCLVCLVTGKSVRSPLGNLNEPLGCCKSCHSLVCGHHGQRNPGGPDFLCVLCVPSLAASTASTMVDPTTKILVQLRDFFNRNTQIIPAEWIDNESLDYFEKWSSADHNLIRLAKRTKFYFKQNATQDVRNTMQEIEKSQKAKTLLALACWMIWIYEIPRESLPESLQIIMDSVGFSED
jgi:uncharacterized protein YfdQ (DUF2303 family)